MESYTSNENEYTTATNNNMDEFQNCNVEQKKADTHKKTVYYSKVLKAKLIYGIISQNGGYLWGEWKG